ncbi:MAG: NAD(P)/FAD-dependent oxidoreductase [Clostridium lundense]|nr:NAD(P)/FAD-dependent oxidoreductase [Clostridium lundense]
MNNKANGTTFIIIGNGAAGFYAADAIRQKNSKAYITMISEESYYSYYRPSLSEYLAKEISDKKLYLKNKNWFEENSINLKLNTKVENILTKENEIVLSDGTCLKYDKLILANGARNFIPPTSGAEKNGVFSLRTINDADKIISYGKKSKKAVVIGGGLLGLEAAWELRNLGLDVTVVEFFPRLLPRQLDEEGAEIFKNQISNCGINVILGDSLVEILGNDNVTNIKLKSGTTLDTDMVLFSVGIRANKELAEQCGIRTDKSVVVNEKMETNIPNIYACGDVAELNGRNYGIWPAAVQMGKVAGTNASGDELIFKDFVSSTIFSSMNTNLFSSGYFDDECDILSYKNEDNRIYKKLFFKDNKLVGCILLGDTSLSIKIVKGIREGYSKEKSISLGLI